MDSRETADRISAYEKWPGVKLMVLATEFGKEWARATYGKSWEEARCCGTVTGRIKSSFHEIDFPRRLRRKLYWRYDMYEVRYNDDASDIHWHGLAFLVRYFDLNNHTSPLLSTFGEPTQHRVSLLHLERNGLIEGAEAPRLCNLRSVLQSDTENLVIATGITADRGALLKPQAVIKVSKIPISGDGSSDDDIPLAGLEKRSRNRHMNKARSTRVKSRKRAKAKDAVDCAASAAASPAASGTGCEPKESLSDTQKASIAKQMQRYHARVRAALSKEQTKTPPSQPEKSKQQGSREAAQVTRPVHSASGSRNSRLMIAGPKRRLCPLHSACCELFAAESKQSGCDET